MIRRALPNVRSRLRSRHSRCASLLTGSRYARQALAFRRAEWAIVGEALALAVAVHVAIERLPLSRLTERLAPAPARRRETRQLPVDRVTAIVNVVTTLVPGSTCLTRALVLSAVLGRQGIATTLIVGAKIADGGFAAHAWLRHGERILVGGGVHEGYVPLYASGMAPQTVEAAA